MNTTTNNKGTTTVTKAPPAPKPAIVPMEIAVAISTERTQFIDMLERRLGAPDATPLSMDELRGMLQLLREFVEDRLAMKVKLRRVQDMVRTLEAQGKGYTKKLLELDGILRGTELVPEDEDLG